MGKQGRFINFSKATFLSLTVSSSDFSHDGLAYSIRSNPAVVEPPDDQSLADMAERGTNLCSGFVALAPVETFREGISLRLAEARCRVDRSGSPETISGSPCCQFCHVVTDDHGRLARSSDKSIVRPLQR